MSEFNETAGASTGPAGVAPDEAAQPTGDNARTKLAVFLRTIWPTQGFYCVAQPKTKGERSWWQHSSYATQEEAAQKLLDVGQLSDVYFTVLSLRKPFIIDQNKIDKARADGRKITDYTGRSYRTNANIAWARSFFLDVDCGSEKDYTTQPIAFAALKEFCRRTGLPKPWVVMSGNGLHVYWPIDADVPADDWRVYALKLKQLCGHNDLKADPTRTADVASVLRPPGTFHHKDPDNPKRVQVAMVGDITPFEDWRRAVDRAHQLTPTGEMHQGDQPLSMQSTPVELGQLRKACTLADKLISTPETVPEPQWYKLLGLVKFVEDGETIAHEVSKGHPDYTAEETDAKLAQLNRKMPDGSTLGPTTCKNMADTCGSENCHTCWFAKTSFYKEGSSSPIVAARRMPLEPERGASSRKKLLTADEVKSLPTQPYRVRGLLPAVGLAAVYGEPACGKTFLALDLALTLANGRENWFGRRVRPAPVVYVALEGRGGFQKRLKAWEANQREIASADQVRFMLDDLSLLDTVGIERLAAEIVVAIGRGSVVFVDTLNQSAPGADENSSADMGKIICNAKLLMERIEGLVVLVHHAGKDRGRGLRGHSSLIAALDTVIEVVSVSGARTWTATKTKDDEAGAAGDFELVPHEVGVDEDGMPIISCAVRQTIRDRVAGSKPIRGERQKAAIEALRPLLAGGRAVTLAMAVEAVAAVLEVPKGRRVTNAKEVVQSLIDGRTLQATNDGGIMLTKTKTTDPPKPNP